MFYSHWHWFKPISSQVEFISLLSTILAIYGVMGPLMPTYEEKYDKFGNLHIPNELGVAYCVVPCAILAVVFHPYVLPMDEIWNSYLSFSTVPKQNSGSNDTNMTTYH